MFTLIRDSCIPVYNLCILSAHALVIFVIHNTSDRKKNQNNSKKQAELPIKLLLSLDPDTLSHPALPHTSNFKCTVSPSLIPGIKSSHVTYPDTAQTVVNLKSAAGVDLLGGKHFVWMAKGQKLQFHNCFKSKTLLLLSPCLFCQCVSWLKSCLRR